MIFGTIAAIILLIFSAPLWILFAVLWGILRATIRFVKLLIEYYSDEQFENADVWIAIAWPVLEGFRSAFSVPAAMWNWAKFGHPWWAILIAFAALGFWSRR